MSSMRNAVQRRNHKERAQPRERSKWGLLEKHADYSQRAADHGAKKRGLAALKRKVAGRNEDEFAFGMVRGGTAGGVKKAERGAANGGGGGGRLSHAVVGLMKTQDVAYLRTVLQSTRRERERVGREVVVGDVGAGLAPTLGNRHRKMFDDAGDELRPTLHATTRQAAGDALEEVSDVWDDSEGEEVDSEVEKKEAEDAVEMRKLHSKEVRRRRLAALRAREDGLAVALDELETQRARMNGAIGGVNKKGVRFKVRQRTR